jgi:hypothetical protein
MTQLVDVVYPLYRAGPEIRYSVRGLLLHAKNIGRIFIIGDRPKFFDGTKFTHIPFKDVNNRPYENVWRKLETIARDERISEKLLWMNDDFYITQPFDATAVPNYCRSMDLFEMPILDRPLANLSPYKKTLKRTRDALAKHRMAGTHFGTHQPVNFEKQKILATVAEFEEDISNGISFRCCYQNMHKAAANGTQHGCCETRRSSPEQMGVCVQRDRRSRIARKRIKPVIPGEVDVGGVDI